MLSSVILPLKSGFELALIIGIAIGGLQKSEKPAMVPVALISFGLATVLGPLAFYLIIPNLIEQMYNAAAQTLATVGLVIILIILRLNIGSAGFGITKKTLLLLAAIGATFPGIVQIYQAFNSQYFQSTGVLSSDLINKTGGIIIGFAVLVLFVIFFIKSIQKIDFRFLMVFSVVAFLLIIVRKMTIILQMLLVLKILPFSPSIFAFVAKLINSSSLLFGTLIAMAFLWVIFIAVKTRTSVLSDAPNPAARRKHLAVRRGSRRLIAALFSLVALIILLLAADSVLANRKVELSPAEKAVADGDEVKIAKKSVKDGQLHRFFFKTSQGTKVRFIIIYKGSDKFGVGFDACPVCGDTGYYQSGRRVICKNCESIINIETIGFPGGCNPLPLGYQTDAKVIRIQVAKLEAAADKFK